MKLFAFVLVVLRHTCSKINELNAIQSCTACLYVHPINAVFVLLMAERLERVAASCGKYFLRVNVLHTIAAAGVIFIALELEMEFLSVKVVLGLFASFFMLGVASMVACERCWLLFWFESNRALGLRNAEK